MNTPLVAIKGLDASRGIVKILLSPYDAGRHLDASEVLHGAWRVFDADGQRLDLSVKMRPFPLRSVLTIEDIPDSLSSEDELRVALVRYLVSCGNQESEVAGEALTALIARFQKTNARLEAILDAAKTRSKPRRKPMHTDVIYHAILLGQMLVALSYIASSVLVEKGYFAFGVLADTTFAILLLSTVVYLAINLLATGLPEVGEKPRPRNAVYALRIFVVLFWGTVVCAFLYHRHFGG